MRSSAAIIFQRRRSHAQGAFSLMELLVVLALVAILSALVAQSIGSLQDSGNITSAAYNVSGILENARAYAMANNTYTWVGFYEEAPHAATVSSTLVAQQPPYTQALSNVGQVLIGVTASRDGTRSYFGNLLAVQKLTVLRNVHLTNLTPLANNLTGNLANRSTADGYLDSEDSTLNSTAAIGFPVILNYTFYKTICFSPRGEALLETPTTTSSSTFSLQHLIEIGLVPTHGGIVDKNAANLVAIQISGLGGSVKIYRP